MTSNVKNNLQVLSPWSPKIHSRSRSWNNWANSSAWWLAGRNWPGHPPPSFLPTAPHPPLRQILEVRPDLLPSNKEQWRQFQTPRSVTWSVWLMELDLVLHPFRKTATISIASMSSADAPYVPDDSHPLGKQQPAFQIICNLFLQEYPLWNSA